MESRGSKVKLICVIEEYFKEYYKHAISNAILSGTFYMVCNARFSLTHCCTSHRSESGEIPLTGDAKADADIMAFVKARQNLLKQSKTFTSHYSSLCLNYFTEFAHPDLLFDFVHIL